MSRRLQRPVSWAIPIATNWPQRVMLRDIRPDMCLRARLSNSCLGTSLRTCANTVSLWATGLVPPVFSVGFDKLIIPAQGVPGPFSYGSSGTAVIQHALFPQLECVLGSLTEKQQQLVQTLEVIRIEQMIPPRFRVPGRPPKDRPAMARAFVAKAVYDMPTTRALLDRLDTDVVLRRICGWEWKSEVPSESVFSRAFAEFSDTQLPQRVHEALIRNTHRDRLVGHLSRDSTAIEAREKPAAKEKAPSPPKRKRGRPKKGEERPKVLKRLDRQAAMSLPEMLDDLPTDCDVGMKKDSKGYKSTWVGYKLHIDVADGQIPISCLLTSASLHDSQAVALTADQLVRLVT